MSNRRKPKIDLRPSLHICPFCRSWTLEVPWQWEWPSEVEEIVSSHVRECLGGNAEVFFK